MTAQQFSEVEHNAAGDLWTHMAEVKQLFALHNLSLMNVEVIFVGPRPCATAVIRLSPPVTLVVLPSDTVGRYGYTVATDEPHGLHEYPTPTDAAIACRRLLNLRPLPPC